MTLRWGLIGPGRIARKFADAMRFLPDQTLHRVAGRDLGRAHDFATQWGGRACDSVEALCADPEVDIVYIASPHSAHAAQATLALRAGKPVLCEKALTRNAAEAEALIALARERRVFLMEAGWSRFLPAWQRVRQLLQSGAIGPVQRVQSSFCFHPPYDPASRLFDPALAGGALLDIGLYNLNLSGWIMALAGQGEVVAWTADGVLAPTGVEQRVEGQLRFAGGATAGFTCALDGRSDNALHIEARDGWIALDAGFHGARALRWQGADGPLQQEALPPDGNGFEGQMRACAEALKAGWLEHPTQPHADSLAVLRLIDAMKQRLGAQ